MRVDAKSSFFADEVIAVCADEGGDCRKAKALLEEMFPALITLPCWAHQVSYLNA